MTRLSRTPRSTPLYVPLMQADAPGRHARDLRSGHLCCARAPPHTHTSGRLRVGQQLWPLEAPLLPDSVSRRKLEASLRARCQSDWHWRGHHDTGSDSESEPESVRGAGQSRYYGPAPAGTARLGLGLRTRVRSTYDRIPVKTQCLRPQLELSLSSTNLLELERY